jgi:hypothetical protein
VARAKRTERAEARRRYRATLATDPQAEDADGADESSGSGSSQGARRSNAAPAGKQGSSGTQERVGFLDAFKLSIRPVHVRQDIASLPWITLHTKAIWLPVVITIGATIATAATGANDMVTGLLFTYFVVFPAIGGVFIGGFLAPRASWLVGVVVGLVSAACYVALGVAGLLPPPFNGQFTLDATGASVSAFIYSPIMGAFFAAAAAWYRRFLALSSPNRNRRQQSQAPKQRPGDGRTRSSGASQKAPAKR